MNHHSDVVVSTQHERSIMLDTLLKVVITLLVVAHLAAALWHGDAHDALAITLPTIKNWFVYIVIIIGPITASILVWTRYLTIGLWLFAFSMLGAFVFGALHHYVMISPDNIEHLPAGDPASIRQFVVSAGTIAWFELGSALVGAFAAGRSRWPTAG